MIDNYEKVSFVMYVLLMYVLLSQVGFFISSDSLWGNEFLENSFIRSFPTTLFIIVQFQ